jgi:hypothetical protein
LIGPIVSISFILFVHYTNHLFAPFLGYRQFYTTTINRPKQWYVSSHWHR